MWIDWMSFLILTVNNGECQTENIYILSFSLAWGEQTGSCQKRRAWLTSWGSLG